MKFVIQMKARLGPVKNIPTALQSDRVMGAKEEELQLLKY